MKTIIMAIFLTGSLMACSSDGFKSSKRAKRIAAAPRSSSASVAADTMGAKDGQLTALDSLPDHNPYSTYKTRINSSGALGAGSGGSFASSYYRKLRMEKKQNQKQDKEYYAKYNTADDTRYNDSLSAANVSVLHDTTAQHNVEEMNYDYSW